MSLVLMGPKPLTATFTSTLMAPDSVKAELPSEVGLWSGSEFSSKVRTISLSLILLQYSMYSKYISCGEISRLPFLCF